MKQASLLARCVLASFAIVVSAGCGGSSDDEQGTASDSSTTAAPTSQAATTAVPPSTPLAVDEFTEPLVDESRPTPAGAETPELPDRTVETRVVYPTAGGPYPLIVMSHGLTGHPDEYTASVSTWAGDGFVVAVPKFPLTNSEVPSAWENAPDVTNQPGDVSFVIDELLAANDDPSSPMYGLIDGEAIGVVGASLGGATTWAVSFNTATRDDRIDSTVIFSGLVLPMGGAEYEFDTGLPLLVIHGDGDDIPMESDLASYDAAVSPKWFVTLLGGDHVPPYTDAESPYDELVTQTLFDFWHGTLDGDPEALDAIETDAVVEGLSTLDHE